MIARAARPSCPRAPTARGWSAASRVSAARGGRGGEHGTVAAVRGRWTGGGRGAARARGGASLLLGLCLGLATATCTSRHTRPREASTPGPATTTTSAEERLTGLLVRQEYVACLAEGDDAVASLLDRVKSANKGFDNRAAKQFVLNAVVRAELNLYVEYDDDARHARVRQHFGGAAGFRNAIMRIRGMTR